jgi:hypothetical protein|tara:strand:- start:127 stop:1038 length:912 start_codon:yes stop_codon:yes gene_type:complete
MDKQSQEFTKNSKHMDFIHSLYEARMTRDTRDQKVLTYTDCCERTYLSLLVIELLNKYARHRVSARNYAKQTVAYTNYNRFRMSATDLYNFIYFVTGDQEAMNKLKDPKSAMALRKKTTLPLMAVNRYLSRISIGSMSRGNTQMFLNVESGLNIKNTTYKAIRRTLMDYDGVTTIDRQNTVTKLIHAVRAKLRSSDIIDDLERLVADRNLETGRVADNEPKISIPDINVQGKELSLYRYLVGTKNIVLVKRFVELALSNKSIPSTVVQAYLPAIKMLHDIVSGGPSYVSMLRALADRAKKNKK